MLELVPMTEAECAAFLEASIPSYAAEHVEAGQWSPEEAIARSREEHEKLLPLGVQTPDHWLVTLRSAGERVGELWYALRLDGAVRSVWVYWIGVDPAHRRNGFATEALRRLEPEARRLGADRILLHVFGTNAPARTAYRRAGFVETNVIMTKRLDAGPGSPNREPRSLE